MNRVALALEQEPREEPLTSRTLLEVWIEQYTEDVSPKAPAPDMSNYLSHRDWTTDYRMGDFLERVNYRIGRLEQRGFRTTMNGVDITGRQIPAMDGVIECSLVEKFTQKYGGIKDVRHVEKWHVYTA